MKVRKLKLIDSLFVLLTICILASATVVAVVDDISQYRSIHYHVLQFLTWLAYTYIFFEWRRCLLQYR